MKVCKFGGTSIADAAQINKVCDIVLSDSERRLVVVSAPGKRNKKDTKVTDMLIACAEARLAGQSGKEEMDLVIARYAEICRDLKVPHDVMKQVEADFGKIIS